MINQLKVSIPSNKIFSDLLLIGLGVLVGGIVALLGLWLWSSYRGGSLTGLTAILSVNLAEWLPLSWRTVLGEEARLLGFPLSAQTKAFWYMARAGGIVAYLLLWFSVVWGLALSTKIMDGLVPAPIAYGLHEFLSLGTIFFAVGHALVLLGDSYIGFSIFHLAIPFIAPYRPLWTGLGTVGLYLCAVLTGSFYIRKQIGQKVWRTLHYLTFGAYLLVLAHGFMAGTDSGLSLTKLMYFTTGFSVLCLIWYRLFTLNARELKPTRR